MILYLNIHPNIFEGHHVNLFKANGCHSLRDRRTQESKGCKVTSMQISKDLTFKGCGVIGMYTPQDAESQVRRDTKLLRVPKGTNKNDAESQVRRGTNLRVPEGAKQINAEPQYAASAGCIVAKKGLTRSRITFISAPDPVCGMLKKLRPCLGVALARRRSPSQRNP